MGVLPGDCEPARDLPHDSAPICGWAVTPGQVASVPNFGTQATIQEWISWSRTHNRRIGACILEWVLMDPRRGAEFSKRIFAEGSSGPDAADITPPSPQFWYGSEHWSPGLLCSSLTR